MGLSLSKLWALLPVASPHSALGDEELQVQYLKPGVLYVNNFIVWNGFIIFTFRFGVFITHTFCLAYKRCLGCYVDRLSRGVEILNVHSSVGILSTRAKNTYKGAARRA